MLQGAAKKRMFLSATSGRRDVKGRRIGDGVKGGARERWGLHRFLTPWPSNAFRGTVVSSLGVASPDERILMLHKMHRARENRRLSRRSFASGFYRDGT